MSVKRLVPLNAPALATLPTASSRPGDVVYLTSTETLYLSDGANWTEISSSGAAATLQIKHYLASEWASANPTLLQGEWGLETNTRLTKLGDGTTAWNSLPYFLEGVPHVFIQNSQPTMATGDLWLDASSSI